jgi:hypothetical protein
MTNELEKQFFQCFGIEPKLPNYNEGYCDGCEIDDDKCESNCPHKARITDRIYLELHCLLNSLDTPPYGLTVKEFKKDILISAIGVLSRNETANRIDNIKHQVRTLFEEG